MIRGLLGAIASLVIFVGAGYAAAVVYVNKDGPRLAERYFHPWGGRGKIAVGGVHKSFLSGALTITKVAVHMPDGRRFTIARVVIRDYDWLNFRRPRHADLSLTGIAATPDGLGEQLGEPVRSAGIDRLVANAHYRYRYDGGTKHYIVEAARLELVDLGTFTATARFEFDGIPAIDALGNRRELIRVAATGKLVAARASFRNRSLVRHVVAGYAAAHKLKRAKAHAALLDALDRERRRARNPIVREALAAALAFFRNPGEIEAVAAPKSPVSLTSATALAALSPAMLKRTLGLTFRARPRARAGDGADRKTVQ